MALLAQPFDLHQLDTGVTTGGLKLFGRPRTTTDVRAEGPLWTTAPALRAAPAASLRSVVRMPVKARWTPFSVRSAPTLSDAGGLESASISSSALS